VPDFLGLVTTVEMIKRLLAQRLIAMETAWEEMPA
jgi:hypothetical protein